MRAWIFCALCLLPAAVMADFVPPQQSGWPCVQLGDGKWDCWRAPPATGGDLFFASSAGNVAPVPAPAATTVSFAASSMAVGSSAVAAGSSTAAAGGATLGFAVGGAKDVQNFRENINDGFQPLPSDITYEGIFYDYYFNTTPPAGNGQASGCNALFCPQYVSAVSKDPFSGQDKFYLAVGLDSNLQASDFARKKLNLVIILDVSGSMGSQFDQYYYDRTLQPFGTAAPDNATIEADMAKEKIVVAREAIAKIVTNLLKDGDRFGMVTFDTTSFTTNPLQDFSQIDPQVLAGHIEQLGPRGSTNFEAGLEQGRSLLDQVQNVSIDEWENRMIILTDAQINTGEIDPTRLLSMMQAAAASNIFTTFIGLGVDFNSDLLEQISHTRGSNYLSAHSGLNLNQRLVDEFDLLVTPLVFDLQLSLVPAGNAGNGSAPTLNVQAVYGAPDLQNVSASLESIGIPLLYVSTLFPSERTDQGVRGGIVLIELNQTNGGNGAQGVAEALSGGELVVLYTPRGGTRVINSQQVNFQLPPDATGNNSTDYYATTGVRKGVLLSRYVNLLHLWLVNTPPATIPPGAILDVLPICLHPQAQANDSTAVVSDLEATGILPYCYQQRSPWERTSQPLTVPPAYKQMFDQFYSSYFTPEAAALNDSSLTANEGPILRKLAGLGD